METVFLALITVLSFGQYAVPSAIPTVNDLRSASLIVYSAAYPSLKFK